LRKDSQRAAISTNLTASVTRSAARANASSQQRRAPARHGAPMAVIRRERFPDDHPRTGRAGAGARGSRSPPSGGRAMHDDAVDATAVAPAISPAR
jgi:hypothetical protein